MRSLDGAGFVGRPDYADQDQEPVTGTSRGAIILRFHTQNGMGLLSSGPGT